MFPDVDIESISITKQDHEFSEEILTDIEDIEFNEYNVT
jgi:hypothetical protein